MKLLSGQKSFSQEQNELVMPGIEPGTFHSLGTIHILRKHLYSTKHNLTTVLSRFKNDFGSGQKVS